MTAHYSELQIQLLIVEEGKHVNWSFHICLFLTLFSFAHELEGKHTCLFCRGISYNVHIELSVLVLVSIQSESNIIYSGASLIVFVYM